MNILGPTATFPVGEPSASARFLVAHFGFREVLGFDGGATVEHPGVGSTLFFLREGLETLDPSQRHARAFPDPDELPRCDRGFPDGAVQRSRLLALPGL